MIVYIIADFGLIPLLLPCIIFTVGINWKNKKETIMPFAAIEKNAEKIVGLSADEIRKYSPGELRRYLEKRNKKKLSFTTEFPVIGRGNVLRDSIITSKEIDKILAHSK